MNLRELLLEKIERTGKGDTAVIGWGRGMGHKGHMYLASSVITHAKELGGDPYFVVSRTVGKDDPITPEEKLAIYKKVFPKQGHIFQTASDEMPDLTRVLGNLNQQGYRNAVVIVGADQVKAFQYLKQYNGKPDKAGNIAFTFDNLDVISRQETNDPSRGEEGPRATPMRQVLLDPNKSEEEQFAVWRDAMNPEISDDEVRDLMQKAKERMIAMQPAPKKAPAKKPADKKPLAVAEEGPKNALGKALYRDLSKEKKASPAQVQRNKERWAQRQKEREQGVAEGAEDSAEAYKAHLIKTMPQMMNFLSKKVQGWTPSQDEMMAAIDTAYMVMKHTGDVKQAGKALMDELNTLHRMSQGQQGVAEGGSKALAQTARRLTDPKDGATAKLRAAGDKRREDQMKGRYIAKRDNDSKDEWGNFKEQLAELSNELLGNYKKAASADATKADKTGDFKRGDKRFSGIVKATNKQFANDMKKYKK